MFDIQFMMSQPSPNLEATINKLGEAIGNKPSLTHK
jgi:hypothetical protein